MSVLKLKAAHVSAEPHAEPSWLAHTYTLLAIPEMMVRHAISACTPSWIMVLSIAPLKLQCQPLVA